MVQVRQRQVWLVATLLLALGCRSKLDVQTEKGAPVPAVVGESPEPQGPETPGTDSSLEPPAPTEHEGGMYLGTVRQVFQTRETITIRVHADVVVGADSFSLLNVTQDEIDPIVILDHEPVPEGMSLFGGGFSLTPTLEGDDMVLSFYPGRDEWRGKFLYGVNKLKLVAHDDVAPRFSYMELTLRDFNIFGPLLSMGDPVAQRAAGFQGWMTVLSAPSVSAGGMTLSTGLSRIVNQP